MLPNEEEIDRAYYKSLLYFKEHKHMLDLDRERDAIEIIKAKNDHIGSIEARMILGKIRGCREFL